MIDISFISLLIDNMAIIIISGFISLILSLALTPVVRYCALRLKIVDVPNERKIHQKPVAYLGGLTFYFVFFSTMLILFTLIPEVFSISLIENFTVILICSTGIVMIGLLDDIWNIRATFKLLAQIIIGATMFFHGFAIESITLPFGGVLVFGHWGVILTILWYVAIMNAINLSDGLDGLAGGICLISSLSLASIFFKSGDLSMALFCIVLGGAILGFLKYNSHPASIFMGDTGSLLLGFLLATIALWNNQKTTSFVALLVPVVATAIPILDTSLAIIRRLMHKQHLFKPDKKHLHHRLLDLGLTQRQTVYFINFLCVYFGIMAFVLAFIPISYVIPMVLLIILFLVGLFTTLIYLENYILPLRGHVERYMKKKQKKKNCNTTLPHFSPKNLRKISK